MTGQWSIREDGVPQIERMIVVTLQRGRDRAWKASVVAPDHSVVFSDDFDSVDEAFKWCEAIIEAKGGSDD